MLNTILRSLVGLTLAVGLVLGQETWALAGTTGRLIGTVTDAETHAPIANVRVVAAASTGTYSGSTDARGFYSIAGVYPDTYTISFSLEGYTSASVPGVSVFADLSQTINAGLSKALKTIAKVASRSVGGAYQPHQTVDTYTVTPHQIQSILGNSLNINEATLLTSLPGASADSGGYPVIRGGRENEENFEFEGVPYTDAFTNQFTNTLAAPGLGLQSAQLTAVGSASQDNGGTGTFNLVAKRGAYPGFATGQFLVGGPAFRHALNAEYGFATPDGRLSDYMALTQNYQGRAYGNLSNNDLNTSTFYSRRFQTESEFINNLVYRFGHANSQSLQFFVDFAQHNIYQGHGGLDLPFRTNDPLYLAFASCVAGLQPNCTPSAANPLNPGPGGAILQPLLNLSADGQKTATQTLGQAGVAPATFYQPNIVYKLGYSWSINPTTFLQAIAYHTNAVTIFDFPLSGGPSATGTSHVDQQGGITSGLKFDLTKQINDRNLFKVGIGYRFLHPVFDQVSNNYGLFNILFSPNGTFVGDFIPDSQCPAAYGGPNQGTCGYIFAHGAPAGTLIPNGYENTSTNRIDYSAYLEDEWSPSDKLKIDGGVRLDAVNYILPPAAIDPFTCTSLYAPTYVVDANGNVQYAPSTNPNAGTYINGVLDPNSVGKCPRATFPQYNNQTRKPRVVEPSVSVSYQLGAHDSLRASYSRSVIFASLGTVDDSTSPGYYAGFANIPGYGHACGPLQDQACANYATQLYWDNENTWGFLNQIQPVRPTTFDNFDFSWGHEFTHGRLNGFAFKITPFYRKAHDEVASVASPKVVNGKIVTDPNTGAIVYGPSLASNAGKNQITGIEAQITRDVNYGLSSQVSLTYQNEFTSVIPLSISEDFFPTIPPSSLNLGNVYRAGFLSPFVGTFDFSYRMHDGWRIATQTRYNIGYPLSPGLLSTATINGVDVNLPNTNASLGLTGAPGGSAQYVDPLNPGSYLNPNIAATRGIPMTAAAGGKLSPPSSFTDLTIEYDGAKRWSAGMQVFNIFNELYTGPVFNGRYQPLATGLSGPVTGLLRTSYLYPYYGFTQYGASRFGAQPYINTPNGIRQYYFYVTVKM